MALKVAELYEDLVVRDNTAGPLNTAERNMGRVGDRVTALKGLMANIGIGALGAQLTRVSTEFNSGMANVASLIPGNSARVKELAGQVQGLRIQLGLTGQDATAGLYQAISAFGDTSDTMRIMDINARSAKAGVATLTDSINLTSAVTKAYGDTSAGAVGKVSDLALMTVRLGQTTFPELAASIGRVTPLTKALNVSQEELFATMATASGVTGGAAEVSTQLRGVLQSLMAPTDSMAELMAQLGYQNGEAMVKALGLHGTIKAITDAATQSGMPLQQYIGSIEGQTLALALAGPQATDYSKKLGEMQKAAGTTDEAFKAQTEGINAQGFALEKLKQAWAVAQEKIGMIGPFLTAGAAVAQLVATIRTLMIPARVAETAALVTQTAAQQALNAAQAQGAITSAAAVGKVGLGAKLLGAGKAVAGAGAGALTAIGGSVGVGGGLAGAGAAGLIGAAVAGAAADVYMGVKIVQYNRDAAREKKAYEESLADPNTGLQAQAKRHAEARRKWLAKQDAERRGVTAASAAASPAMAGVVIPPTAPAIPRISPPVIPSFDTVGRGTASSALAPVVINVTGDAATLMQWTADTADKRVDVKLQQVARLTAAGG